MVMTRAIATPYGQPTLHVELTPAEEAARNAEIKENEARDLAQAPYIRLTELDEVITRQGEAIAKLEGRVLTKKEQAAKDEKVSIRAKLKQK